METTPLREPADQGPVLPAQGEPEPAAPAQERFQPLVLGAQGSLAHDPEYAAYIKYKGAVAAVAPLQDSHLVDENDEPLLFPGCVCCGRPMVDGDHRECRGRLRGSEWNACRHRHGSRTNKAGEECRACFGIGFIETDAYEGLVGSLYIAYEVVGVAGR